jgi:hypothetical protein
MSLLLLPFRMVRALGLSRLLLVGSAIYLYRRGQAAGGPDAPAAAPPERERVGAA